METIIKRKNIDLPIEVLQKLSLMAVAQGRSLKAYIEQILINKANSISIGQGRAYTMDEIRKSLGV